MTQTKAERLQARDFIPRSNTEAGRRILASAPPDVPGYGQFMDFLVDMIGRKIEAINPMPVVPNDVSAYPDIIFRLLATASSSWTFMCRERPTNQFRSSS